MLVPELEKSIGIEVYATSSLGVGGFIRQHIEDFIVKEVLVDGSKAELNHYDSQVLGASPIKTRYLICVLVKRDWDTFLALQAIARQLELSPRYIQIAGIKDAKAVTAQYITIEDRSFEEVQKVQVKDLHVHPIGYFHSRFSSYYLLGNHFDITIRAISHSKSMIENRIMRIIEEFKEVGGVPNFFGHQRFGTIRPITHLVGKAIVQDDFREAAWLYLAKTSLHEHPESRIAREQLQRTQDFKKALKIFPKQLHYERWMLKHLASKPEDFVGAFRRLPMKLRKLFPQAYQAYLFNKFLSKRLEKGFLLDRAEIGDYVVNVERSGLPMIKMRRKADTETITEVNEAIQVGKMRLAMPLIGFKSFLSKGVQDEIERQILEEEGITAANFKIEAMPETSLRGGLRTVLVPVNDFLLKAVAADQVNQSKREAEVSFTLHRGSYATIVLRELMKPADLVQAGF